jgi:hypothetical protein
VVGGSAVGGSVVGGSVVGGSVFCVNFFRIVLVICVMFASLISWSMLLTSASCEAP